MFKHINNNAAIQISFFFFIFSKNPQTRHPSYDLIWILLVRMQLFICCNTTISENEGNSKISPGTVHKVEPLNRRYSKHERIICLLYTYPLLIQRLEP